MTQAEQDRRIDYIEFPSNGSWRRTKAFYGEVFGWEFTDYGPDYTSFVDGRMNGGFRGEKDVETGGALVVMYAADLEGIEAEVKAHGGTIVTEIFEFPGGRRFHFADPVGNVLAVWSDE